MKKILLCTDGSEYAKNIYRYGAWFAQRLAWKIAVLFVADIRGQQVVSTGNLSGAIGLDASETLLNKLVELEHEKAKLNYQKGKLILATAAQNLQELGIEPVKLIHKTGFLVDCVAELEPGLDLVVLGKRGEAAKFAKGHLGANVERIVRNSQKPCLVTSHDFKPIKRVLLAFDGGNTCEKMLKFMLNSGVFKDLELHIITVTKNQEDSQAIAQLASAKQRLQMGSFEPIGELCQGDPATAIAQYIANQDISLLLMGAYGHSTMRELVIGSTTARLLRSSQIPVLLWR